MNFVYSDRHRLHEPRRFLLRGQWAASPESPERAARLLTAVERDGHTLLEPRGFPDRLLSGVHTPEYLTFLRDGFAQWQALRDPGEEMLPNAHPARHMNERPRSIVGLAGYHMADLACPIGPGTWEAARAAADVALTAASLVLEGAPVAYALCRPPGHHASADMAGGFCYLNNVAIAADMLARQGRRVAILDVDVHHGNGTQAIFYRRADVLFVSLHGDPAGFYPFYAGYAHERGEGVGRGYNLNLPLPAKTADEPYLAALEHGLAAITSFAPDMLLVSLGLDAQAEDPLGILKISTAGFGRIADAIAGLGLPTVLIQEGGYLCDPLGANLASFLAGFEAARAERT